MTTTSFLIKNIGAPYAYIKVPNGAAPNCIFLSTQRVDEIVQMLWKLPNNGSIFQTNNLADIPSKWFQYKTFDSIFYHISKQRIHFRIWWMKKIIPNFVLHNINWKTAIKCLQKWYSHGIAEHKSFSFYSTNKHDNHFFRRCHSFVHNVYN